MVEAMLVNPYRVGGTLQRELAGIRSAWRGAYRIVYEINETERLVGSSTEQLPTGLADRGPDRCELRCGKGVRAMRICDIRCTFKRLITKPTQAAITDKARRAAVRHGPPRKLHFCAVNRRQGCRGSCGAPRKSKVALRTVKWRAEFVTIR